MDYSIPSSFRRGIFYAGTNFSSVGIHDTTFTPSIFHSVVADPLSPQYRGDVGKWRSHRLVIMLLQAMKLERSLDVPNQGQQL